MIGLWPIDLAAKLKTALDGGLRKASDWAEQAVAVEVLFPPAEIGGSAVDPFFNVNRPDDLAGAERLIRELAAPKG